MSDEQDPNATERGDRPNGSHPGAYDGPLTTWRRHAQRGDTLRALIEQAAEIDRRDGARMSLGCVGHAEALYAEQ